MSQVWRPKTEQEGGEKETFLRFHEVRSISPFFRRIALARADRCESPAPAQIIGFESPNDSGYRLRGEARLMMRVTSSA
jgi:hypothetical protein